MKPTLQGLCINVLLLLFIAGSSVRSTNRTSVRDFCNEVFLRIVPPVAGNKPMALRTLHISDIRYFALLLLLANDIEENPGPSGNKHRIFNIAPTKLIISKSSIKKLETEFKKSLFSELPTIEPEDYGQDYCKKCWNAVTMTDDAISCDACLAWTHLKCSDVSKATYKRYQEAPHFHWLCAMCRETERIPIATKYVHNPNDTQIKDLKQGSIIHFNCRSIHNKMDEIQTILDKAKPNIMILTETWLDDSFPKGTLAFKGYRHFRKDRSQAMKQKHKKNNGGGVAIIFKENLKVTQCKDLNKDDDEILWVSTRLRSKLLLIGAIYRPSYCNLLDNDAVLEEHLQHAFQKTDKVMVIGDLNINMLKTENRSESRQQETLKQLFGNFGMTQIINNPTRITHNSETLIDHIWLSSSLDARESGTTTGISDHSGTYTYLGNTLEKEDKTITARSYKRYNKEGLIDDYKDKIANSCFEDLVKENNLNDATKTWSEVVLSICDKHAPERTTTFNPKTDNVPWYTDNIIKLKADKQVAYLNFRKRGDKKSKTILRSISNKLKNLKKKERKHYYRQKIEKYSTDNKKLWGILKEVSRTKTYKDEVLPDKVDDTVADKFNSYFATIGKKIQQDLGVNFTFIPDKNNRGFAFNDVTPDNIEKLIDNLKSGVATGFDKIPARILKDLKSSISTDICKLVNLSFRMNTFPSNLKHAIITPIYKDKGCHNSSENFRPISILPVLSKIFERAATNQIVEFLEKNGLLYSSQHAYRKQHSTTTALIETTNFIYSQLDKKNYVGLVATDLSKAFDTLSHDLLLTKLQNMGFSYSSITWFRSYLSNRTQQTKLGNIKSSIATTEAGVPQGSILGPILFISFTADFHHTFPNCKIHAYADDTQILLSAKTLEDLKHQIESTIALAQTWFTNNSLKINPTKTEIMVFSNSDIKHSISFSVKDDGSTKNIFNKKKIKILGVILDDRLTWHDHIKKVKSRASGVIRNLARTTPYLPQKSRRTLYDALVTPHFSYCDVVWGGANKTISNELQRTGNFAAKAMLGMKKKDSASEALQRLNMMTLDKKRDIHLGVLTHKLVQGKGPKELVSACKSLTNRKHHHFTRNSARQDMSSIQHRTVKSESSFTQRSIKCWNNIPLAIRNIDNTSNFKKSLQQFHMTKFKSNVQLCDAI